MPGRGVYWKVKSTNKNGLTFDQLDPSLQSQIVGPGSGAHVIEEEGTPLPFQPNLNFVGAGVTATDGTGETIVTIPGNPQAGHVIEDEGTPLAQQTDMNFVGAGVTAADAGGKTVVTIPGGAVGGLWSQIGDYIATIQESSHEFDITDIDFSADSLIVAVLDGTVNNSTDIEMQVNQDSSAFYFQDGSRIIGGVESILDVNSDTKWTLASNAIIEGAFPFTIIVELQLTAGAVGGTADAPRIFSRGNSNGYEHIAGRLQVEKADITHVRFDSSLFPWRVGTRFTLYKVSRT